MEYLFVITVLIGTVVVTPIVAIVLVFKLVGAMTRAAIRGAVRIGNQQIRAGRPATERTGHWPTTVQ